LKMMLPICTIPFNRYSINPVNSAKVLFDKTHINHSQVCQGVIIRSEVNGCVYGLSNINDLVQHKAHLELIRQFVPEKC
jgi:hypothetical protein